MEIIITNIFTNARTMKVHGMFILKKKKEIWSFAKPWKMRGGAGTAGGPKDVGQISQGCRGIFFLSVLPAIFYHPFALLFSMVETAPVLSRRYIGPWREKERFAKAGRCKREEGRERYRKRRENSPVGSERARSMEERAWIEDWNSFCGDGALSGKAADSAGYFRWLPWHCYRWPCLPFPGGANVKCTSCWEFTCLSDSSDRPTARVTPTMIERYRNMFKKNK